MPCLSTWLELPRPCREAFTRTFWVMGRGVGEIAFLLTLAALADAAAAPLDKRE